MNYICGADPGLRSGAIGVIDGNGKFIRAFDISAKEDRIDVRKLMADIRASIPAGSWTDFVIENVSSMPGQGIASTYKFGRATGAIEAVAEAFPHSAVHFVSPRTWKRDMNLSSDKRLSIDMARELWPDARSELYLQKHNNKCEALLLAEWFRRSL